MNKSIVDKRVYKLVVCALFAALSYLAFVFIKIDIPTGAGKPIPIHIANSFPVIAALLIGGVYGGLAGSIGMTIADLTVPAYVTSAPKTFILKLLIGCIVGLVAHKIAKINLSNDSRYIFRWSLISAISGLLFNVIFDPVFGFLYNKYILGLQPQAAKILATYLAGITLINAIISVIIAVVVYNSIRPILKRSVLFIDE